MAVTVTCCMIRHLPGFPITVIRPIPKALVYRNFSKKIKGKRQKVIKDNVDIEGILRSSGAASTTKPAIEIAATNDSPKDREIKTWQTSEERTNLLKQGERRVAIIAVVTMLIGFGAVKLFVYDTEKRKKNSEAVEQPV